MSFHLFLDDERIPAQGHWILWSKFQASGNNPAEANRFDWIVARTCEEGQEAIETLGTPDHVQFDHDLATPRTGADFANLLIERALDGHGFPTSYDVHSQNPRGVENICGKMDGYLKHLNTKTEKG